MLIAQITDVHVGFDRDNPDELNMQRLRAVMKRLETGPDQPGILLLTGDLTEAGDRESYARLAAELTCVRARVCPMVGNHDDRAALLAAFPQTPTAEGFIQYVVEQDGFRLIVLDTLEPGRHGGAFCEARARWLRAQLGAEIATPTYIAMHHPPFESGLAWLDSAGSEAWIARFAAAIEGFAHIRGIFAGHLHRTIHTQWNGIAISVCASIAPAVALDLTPIDPDRPDGRELITDAPPGFALHRWDGSMMITHCESVDAHHVMARFDAALQPMIKGMMAERGH